MHRIPSCIRWKNIVKLKIILAALVNGESLGPLQQEHKLQKNDTGRWGDVYVLYASKQASKQASKTLAGTNPFVRAPRMTGDYSASFGTPRERSLFFSFGRITRGLMDQTPPRGGIRLILLFLLMILSVSPARADITTGLVGWWKLDEASGGTVIDSSQQGNHGTAIGTTINAQCKINSCRSFNGTGDYVSVGTQAIYDFGISSAAISLWVYLPPFDGQYRGLVAKRTNTNYVGWSIFRSPSSNVIGSEWASAHGGPYFSVSAALRTNVWSHIVVVLDRVNHVLQMYLNGVLINPTKDITSLGGVNNPTSLVIGKEVGIHNFNSLIDDVRIYNRALSAADVVELYETGFTRLSGAVLRGAVIR